MWLGVVWCGVIWCGVPKALLPEGNGPDVYPRVQVNGRAVCLSAGCVPVCCRIARPVLRRTWPVPFCRRLCTITQCLVGPLHHVCHAASSVLCLRCRTASCYAPHCTVCPTVLHFRAVGCGLWNPYNTLPHCLGTVGSATPAMHCFTACGQWAVELVLCTTRLPRGSGHWNSCKAAPRCPGAVGSGFSAVQCHTAWRRWPVELLQCAGPQADSMGFAYEAVNAVKRGTLAVLCHTACGQWTMQLLHCPHCPRVVGSAIPAMQCHSACWQWAIELLHCFATLPGDSGQCNSCNVLPHYLGAVGSGTPALHCRGACGEWAMKLLLWTATAPRGSG